MKWVIGVDEAGRGPLAGPVAVGMVKVPIDFDWSKITGVGDSKQIKESNRKRVLAEAKELRYRNQLDFSVSQVGSSVIDEKGITFAINLAIKRNIKKLGLNPNDCEIKLDGSLKAPIEFRQETIIRGDSKELVIGLASIVAKVTRDDYMKKASKQYFQYDLDVHKGYGTKAHREAIAKYGKSPIHRVSYCKNIVVL
jgi:ribonuclease HII